jgi:kynurenine formamidase
METPEIVDLSQEIFDGMPVYKGLPPVHVKLHATHEQWDGIEDSDQVSPSVYAMQMGEHTGTHVDALNHMSRENFGESIDSMPLHMFYTRGLCLDLSEKGLKELIDVRDLEKALQKTGLTIEKGDTVLLYTDHYRKTFGTEHWWFGPGLSVAATEWLGEKGIAAFGVETMSPGIPKQTNKEVHRVCGRMGFTNYENMANLHRVIGRGIFRFIGLPLKIKGGTGSPVRAVAVFE